MAQLQIPWQTLSDDALRGVIEEFATRDGTDYGAVEIALASKVDTLRRQLAAGEICIVFDDDAQSCHIVPAQQLAGSTGD